MATHIHKLSGDRLTIHKDCGEVVSCNLIDEPKHFNIRGELVYQRIVCLAENVVEIGQLKLL